MAGQPCKICADAKKLKLAAQLIAEGHIDRIVAERLGLPGNAGRMVVARHRTRHVEAPAKAIIAATNKGRDVQRERARVIAAAEAGDPATFLELTAIVADMRGVSERLERTAAAAEGEGQRLAVASLSAQQLRATEVRAKLGSVGGYAPQKAPGALENTAFVLNIRFGDGTGTRLAMDPEVVDGQAIPVPGGAVIGSDPDELRDEDDDAAAFSGATAALAALELRD